MTWYDPNLVCEISANTGAGHPTTGAGSCKDYCAALGRKCFHAQDNVGLCGVVDAKVAGEDMSENGMSTLHGPMDIT